MNDRKLYEVLANGQPVQTILPDLLESLGAEAGVLYFLGEAEAWVAFRHASLHLLEKMRNRLIDELHTALTAARQTLTLPEHVELALTKKNLARLGKRASAAHVEVQTIRFGEEIIGALALSFKTVPFSRSCSRVVVRGAAGKTRTDHYGLEQLLAAFGFAYRIEKTRSTSEEVQEDLERLALVGSVFAESHLLDRTLTRLLEIAVGLVGASVGLIVVKPASNEKPIPPVGWGLPPSWIDNLCFRKGRKVLDVVLDDGQPCFLRTLGALDNASPPDFLAGLVAVPLTYEGGVLGCMCIANPPSRFFETAVERRALSALASLAGSAIRNARYVESEIRTERLREEVRLAARVQADLLPRHLPNNDQVEAAAVIRLASHLGGDFYDIFSLGEGRWGVMIADVSGKGSSGAILMATARAYLHAFAREATMPGEVLQKMNGALVRDFTEGHFLTATYVIVDLPGRRLQVAGAGHHPVFLLRPDGQIDCLPSDDLPLGILPESHFVDSSIPIERSTTILFYTDGLVEAASPEGRFFGSERMLTALSHLKTTNAQEVINYLLAEVQNWTKSATFADDLTILAVRIK